MRTDLWLSGTSDAEKSVRLYVGFPGSELSSDADVITLADKCIVVRSFVCRNYDNDVVETGKFSDKLRVTENGLVSGVDRALKLSNSTFQNIGDQLNPLGKSVDVDILFVDPPAGTGLTRVNDDIKIVVP